jgi:hypothetical protein
MGVNILTPRAVFWGNPTEIEAGGGEEEVGGGTEFVYGVSLDSIASDFGSLNSGRRFSPGLVYCQAYHIPQSGDITKLHMWLKNSGGSTEITLGLWTDSTQAHPGNATTLLATATPATVARDGTVHEFTLPTPHSFTGPANIFIGGMTKDLIAFSGGSNFDTAYSGSKKHYRTPWTYASGLPDPFSRTDISVWHVAMGLTLFVPD